MFNSKCKNPESLAALLLSSLQWHLLLLEKAQVSLLIQRNRMFLLVTELVYITEYCRCHPHKSFLGRNKMKSNGCESILKLLGRDMPKERENPCKGSRQLTCCCSKDSSRNHGPSRPLVCYFGVSKPAADGSHWLLNRLTAAMAKLDQSHITESSSPNELNCLRSMISWQTELAASLGKPMPF